jgi:multiple sugar transport system ATP-binding protein
MATLELDSITKTFRDGGGEIIAVDDISMSIDDGEFLVVVGPSGCGKSTMLRMVAGLETVTSGTIALGDRVINDVKSQDRDIAMVFQSYALYPHMTVRENMSFGLEESSELPDDEIARMVSETGELLDISELLDRKPSDLSGGQQQRVALGRAIVRDPEVFLMDEPLSNLDAKLKMHMRTELQRIHDELETTTVYVTHDQEEAMTMSDRIVILAEGHIQQVGTPDEIYNRPANLFVADFIGSPAMNFFDVELDGAALVSEDFEYPLSKSTAETVRDATTTSELTLGVRPEDLSIVDSPGERTIEVTVDVVEPVGSDNYIYAKVAGEEVTIRVPADVKPTVGETVSMQFNEDDIHLFDTGTEQNVFAGAEHMASHVAESVS